MDTKFELDDSALDTVNGGVRSQDREEFQVNVREGDDLGSITTSLRMNHGKLSQSELSKAAQLLLDAKNQWGAGRYYVVVSKTGVTVER